MLRRTARGFGVLLVALLALLIVFLIGMRTKSPAVLRTVRRVNRAVFNPRQMASAGTPGAYAAVIQHRGRTSGRSYDTPVGAVATDGGFLIALPYRADTDWVKNVLAAGSATLVHEGETYAVDQPEIVPMEAVVAHFSAGDQRTHRLFGVDQALRLRAGAGGR